MMKKEFQIIKSQYIIINNGNIYQNFIDYDVIYINDNNEMFKIQAIGYFVYNKNENKYLYFDERGEYIDSLEINDMENIIKNKEYIIL